MYNKQNKLPATLLVILASVVALTTFTPAFSITQLVALQSRVLQLGVPDTGGSVAVTIWSAATGGSVLYADTFTNAINNGYFDLMLGSSSELNLTYGSIYYLDVSVDGEDVDWANPAGSTVERIQFQSRNGQIPSGQIRPDAVNATHISPNSVNSSHLRNDAVTAGKIAPNSVNSSHIANDAVTSAKIAPNSVNSTHIRNATVTGADIALNSINTSHIMNGTIFLGSIATSAINTSHILNNVILNEDISLAANISGSKINTSGFCPAPSNYTGYPCYSHFGCSPPRDYTRCLVDPNNSSWTCFNNTEEWRLEYCYVNCTSEMAKIIDTRYGAGVFCIDRWEAYQLSASVAGSARGQSPWMSITHTDAEAKCTAAGKHICTSQEWLAACNYGSYSFSQIDDYTSGGSAIAPCVTGASSEESTGTYKYCHTTEGVYDMVGNAWEWTDAGLTIDNPIAGWSAGHVDPLGDGLGWYTEDDVYVAAPADVDRVFRRGGKYSDGSKVGCFAVDLERNAGATATSTAFRCCK